MGPWLGINGPDPMPSLEPGDQVVEVDGQMAILRRTPLSMRWHLVGAPEYIEAHWGEDIAVFAPTIVQEVIDSWRWGPPTS